jgi:hypothetical protein
MLMTGQEKDEPERREQDRLLTSTFADVLCAPLTKSTVRKSFDMYFFVDLCTQSGIVAEKTMNCGLVSRSRDIEQQHVLSF